MTDQVATDTEIRENTRQKTIKSTAINTTSAASSAPFQTISALASAISLQDASMDIWAQKYCLKDSNGQPLDANINDTFERLAHTLAQQESSPALQQHWLEQFRWALNNGAIPAGRIIANAGVHQHKHATSTVNTTVSDNLEDDMAQLLEKVQEAGLTLKSGAGIGYEFSTLRPKGSFVHGSGAASAGPLGFMDIFDKVCANVSSAGGSRGAQMATLDVSHPDVLEFIKAKREDGRLRHFNLSLLITDEFMQAVEQDQQWPLVFPISKAELASEGKSFDDIDQKQLLWKIWPV